MNVEKLKDYIANNSNKIGCIYIHHSIYENCNNVDALLVLCAIATKFRTNPNRNKGDYFINLMDIEHYYINEVRINKNIIVEFIKYMTCIREISIDTFNELYFRGISKYPGFGNSFKIITHKSILYYLDIYLNTLNEHDLKLVYENITNSYCYMGDYFDGVDDNCVFVIHDGDLYKYKYRKFDTIGTKHIVVDIWINKEKHYDKKRKVNTNIKRKPKKKPKEGSNIIIIR